MIDTILVVVKYSIMGVMLIGAVGGLIESIAEDKKYKKAQEEARKNYKPPGHEYEDCDKRFFIGRSQSKKFH